MAKLKFQAPTINYVKREAANDTLYLYCIPNTEKTKLSQTQRDYSNQVTDVPTDIMQPDTTFSKDYADLADFENGTIKSGLEKRDSLSWKDKSWVIGIVQGDNAKAYDWNALVKENVIEDSLPNLPVVLALEQDSVSFHVWNRRLDSTTLHFETVSSDNTLTDVTGSKGGMNGACISGPLKGKQLEPVKAYQEFWHSWKTFHPYTQQYK